MPSCDFTATCTPLPLDNDAKCQKEGSNVGSWEILQPGDKWVLLASVISKRSELQKVVILERHTTVDGLYIIDG